MIMAALGLFVSLCGCAFGFGEKGDNGLGKKAKTNESGISSFPMTITVQSELIPIITK